MAKREIAEVDTNPETFGNASQLPPSPLRQRLVSNTLVQFLPPGLRALLGILLSAALARYLGVAGYGSYALVLATVAVFNGVLSDWGLGTICLREISRSPQDQANLVVSAAVLQLLACVLTYLLLLASLLLLPYPAPVRLAIAIYGLTIFFTVGSFISLPFQADLRMSKLVWPSMLGISLNFVLTMGAILVGGNLVLLVAASMAALLFQYLWIAAMSLKVLRPPVGNIVRPWGMYAREAWPLGLSTVFSTVAQQAPLLALSLFSLQAVGIFGAAARIPGQLVLLPLIVRTSTFPLLSRYWQDDRERFCRLLERLLSGAVLLTIPAILALIGLSTWIVVTIFGRGFSGAAMPLNLLLVSGGILMPTILAGEAMVAAGYQRLNMVIQVGAAIMLVVALAVLARRFGATGAAWAVVVTTAATSAATFASAYAKLDRALFTRPLVAGLFGAVSGGFACWAGMKAGPIYAAVAGVLVSLGVLSACLRATVADLIALARAVAVGHGT